MTMATPSVQTFANQSVLQRKRQLTCLGWLLVVSAVIFCTGCEPTTLTTTYGASAYPEKNTSVNGLGVFEKFATKNRFIRASRLSPRLDDIDCLILVGDTLDPPAKEARDWLEDWLSSQSGRCLIYFGRDFDAAEIYHQQTIAAQASDRQARARLDLAEARLVRDRKLYESVSEDAFCRWFYLRVSQREQLVTSFNGPWSEGLDGVLKWPIRSYLDVPDPEYASDVPTWKPVTPRLTFPRFSPPPTQNNTSPKPKVYSSIWSDTDINDDETWESEWDKVPDCEVLLAGSDDTPLIMRLTSDRYPTSQILTIANAAPLVNGMMVDPQFRLLAQKIAAEIPTGSRVAVLPYTAGGMQVSEVPDSDDEIAGLAVLMTWPLNILMAHLAFLGLLVCFALFPILGRPQPLRSSAISDFGQHAEALGQMLSRTRDLSFAMTLVRDYLRIVRGEAAPSWLQSAQTAETPPNVTTIASASNTGSSKSGTSNSATTVETVEAIKVSPNSNPNVTFSQPKNNEIN